MEIMRKGGYAVIELTYGRARIVKENPHGGYDWGW